jgi:hypothetical protein
MKLSPSLLAAIEEALLRVEDSLSAPPGDRGSKKKALEAIFDLNNAVGRCARSSGTAAGGLTELQLSINLITVGVKTGDAVQAGEGLKMSLESFKRLKNEN